MQPAGSTCSQGSHSHQVQLTHDSSLQIDSTHSLRYKFRDPLLLSFSFSFVFFFYITYHHNSGSYAAAAVAVSDDSAAPLSWRSNHWSCCGDSSLARGHCGKWKLASCYYNRRRNSHLISLHPLRDNGKHNSQKPISKNGSIVTL